MTPTDKTHYTVPELVAFDIATNPPPPGVTVNCISCWGVSRSGLPDGHTVAWYPLAKTPASAKRRAMEMIKMPDSVPSKPVPLPFACTCDANDDWYGFHHAGHCSYHDPN